MSENRQAKSILEMARGEMAKVIDNILDANTNPTQKRKVTLTLELTPDDDRQNILVNFAVQSKLAPMVPTRTTLWVAGELSTGEVQVVEMVPQVPGQMSMDGAEQEAPAALKIVKIS